MLEMSFEYLNKLADQVIVISSLLAGFSIAVVANFLVSEMNTRLTRYIMRTSVLAAGFFLVSLFAMTKVLMMTTSGFPLEASSSELNTASIIGGVTLFFGIVSLLAMIALAGWTKSKTMGKFTTIVGSVTLLLIMIMLT